MQTEKQLTFNIEFDGNDGTGKTYVINLIKQFFNNCIFKDRGIFSKATLLNKESEEKCMIISIIILIMILYILF